MIGARTLYATALLVAPDAVLRGLPHERIGRPASVFARVLGARHLAQAALLEGHRTRAWLLVGTAIDAAHATSMLVLAARSPRHRALALTNAAIATTLAAAGLHEARRA